MRIGWVGGVERNESDLTRMAHEAGHSLTFNSGHTQGRAGHELKCLVERSDLVIILTDVNSHGAVLQAKRLVKQYGKASLLTRRLGAVRFRMLLDAASNAEPLLQTGT